MLADVFFGRLRVRATGVVVDHVCPEVNRTLILVDDPDKPGTGISIEEQIGCPTADSLSLELSQDEELLDLGSLRLERVRMDAGKPCNDIRFIDEVGCVTV